MVKTKFKKSTVNKFNAQKFDINKNEMKAAGKVN